MWRYMKAYLQYGMPHIQFNVINNQIFVPLFMAQPIFELVYVHVKIVLDGCLVYRGAVTYNATYVDLVLLLSTGDLVVEYLSSQCLDVRDKPQPLTY